MKRTMLVLATLCALTALDASARSYVAGRSMNGADTTRVINDHNDWVVVLAEHVTLELTDTAEHGCVVTASADVHSPFDFTEDALDSYLFTLSRNVRNPPSPISVANQTGFEREVSFAGTDTSFDAEQKTVSVNRHFLNVTNERVQTFYLLARKSEVTDANAQIVRAAISVVCVNL
jgi:hypothetical protein